MESQLLRRGKLYLIDQLSEKARAARKRIVLPEGCEPRTIKAAAICARRDIAGCVLLGNPAEVQDTAKSQDVELPDAVQILDPALQRSANVISIGPMLQGLRRPVNDLSRGALVDDIVYTIALTAIQATQV